MKKAIVRMRVAVVALCAAVLLCLLVAGVHLFAGRMDVDAAMPWIWAVAALWAPLLGCLIAYAILRARQERMQQADLQRRLDALERRMDAAK